MDWKIIKDSLEFRFAEELGWSRLCFYKGVKVGHYKTIGNDKFALTLYKPDGSVFSARCHCCLEDVINALAISVFVLMNIGVFPGYEK